MSGSGSSNSSAFVFRKFLKKIDNGLAAKDIKRLQFLCKDLGIPAQNLEQITRGLHLFKELEQLVLLSREDVSLLVELLQIISRRDLEKEAMEWSTPSPSLREQPRISTYRRFLLNVALESTREDLEEIKSMASEQISSNLEEIKDMFQFLTVMEKECLISEKNVSVLREVLTNQLVIEKVKAYERTYSSAATEIRASSSSISNTLKGSHLQDPAYMYTREFSTGNIYPLTVQPSSTSPAYHINQSYESKSQASVTIPANSSQPLAHLSSMRESSTSNPYPHMFQPQSTDLDVNDGCTSYAGELSSDISLKPRGTTHGQRNEFSFQQHSARHDMNVLEKDFKDLGIAHNEASSHHASSKGSMHSNEQLKYSTHSTYQLLSSINTFPPDLMIEIGKGCENNPGPQSNVVSSLKHVENLLGSDGPYKADHCYGDVSPSDIPIPARAVMPCYKMNQNPRGLCIVINNETFEKTSSKLDYRQGSDKDALKLLKLFHDLNFQVWCVNNRTAREMYDLLDSIRKYDHQKYDCFICCILSHGRLGEVYGSDSVTIPITELTGLFTGVKCESLAGKPKLFFIQACQGEIKQVGVKTSPVTDNPTNSIPTIPNENDFLLGYSTVLGYASYRSPEKGSWYIISLVNLIKQSHNEIDMQNVLALVNGHMAKCADKEGFKQSSFHQTTLTKALYL